MVVRSMTGDELVRLLDSEDDSLAVIDVRDDDRVGGHISHSLHYPSSNFRNDVFELIPRLEKEKKTTVVFHCALSQQRGPLCARLYAQAMEETGGKGSLDQSIYVLRGGFTEFQKLHGKDPKLVEEYDQELWEVYGN